MKVKTYRSISRGKNSISSMSLTSALPVPSVHNFTVARAFLRFAVHSNRCQFWHIHTYVPLSPSSTIWYIIDCLHAHLTVGLIN